MINLRLRLKFNPPGIELEVSRFLDPTDTCHHRVTRSSPVHSMDTVVHL